MAYMMNQMISMCHEHKKPLKTISMFSIQPMNFLINITVGIILSVGGFFFFFLQISLLGNVWWQYHQGAVQLPRLFWGQSALLVIILIIFSWALTTGKALRDLLIWPNAFDQDLLLATQVIWFSSHDFAWFCLCSSSSGLEFRTKEAIQSSLGCFQILFL